MTTTDDPRTEREKAAYGPRVLKTPGTPEWCWQTLDGLVRDYKYIDKQFEEVEQALHELEKAQAWKVIPTDKPYGTRARMLATELKVDFKTIQRNINQARERRTLGAQGRPKKGEEKGANSTLKNRGSTSRAYILARLDRDGLNDLAARVRAGELSASAAAHAAGWRKPPSAIAQVLKLLPKLSTREWRQVKAKEDSRRKKRG